MEGQRPPDGQRTETGVTKNLLSPDTQNRMGEQAKKVNEAAGKGNDTKAANEALQRLGKTNDQQQKDPFERAERTDMTESELQSRCKEIKKDVIQALIAQGKLPAGFREFKKEYGDRSSSWIEFAFNKPPSAQNISKSIIVLRIGPDLPNKNLGTLDQFISKPQDVRAIALNEARENYKNAKRLESDFSRDPDKERGHYGANHRYQNMGNGEIKKELDDKMTSNGNFIIDNTNPDKGLLQKVAESLGNPDPVEWRKW